MEATEWILVAVVVVVLVALAAWLATRQRTKKQHEHAEHLREEAQEHAAEVPETQVRAKEAEAEAERARLEAERAQAKAREAQVAATQQQAVHEDRLRTADQVDPRVDTSSDDYAPGTTAHDHRATAHDPDTVLDADDPRRTDGTDGTHRA
jgi:ABC-type nickel/cobalt efflux system permease component RcnA